MHRTSSVTLVGVLGSGPAALVAAQAASMAGARPIVYRADEKSIIRGAQYIHHAIPGIQEEDKPDGYLEYVFKGTSEVYKEKVYGNAAVETSWEKFGQTVPFWNMVTTYEALWEKWGWDTVAMPMITSPLHAAMLLDDMYKSHDMLISTIPLKRMCPTPGPCGFESAEVWISMGSPMHSELPNNTIIYNGFEGDAWYRTSSIMGYVSTEWPTEPEGQPAVRVVKPTATRCHHWQEVHKVGRYGAWCKEVLVDQVYGEVEGKVRSLVSRR